MPKNLLKILDVETLLSFPEGTKILLISPIFSQIYQRVDHGQMKGLLLNDEEDAVIFNILDLVTAQELFFVNYKIRPWWITETEDDPKNHMECYAILEEKKIDIQKILRIYDETMCINNEDLVVVIAFLEDLSKKLFNMGCKEYVLFRADVLRKLEMFRGFKSSRESSKAIESRK
jgi:hypothetical protein